MNFYSNQSGPSNYGGTYSGTAANPYSSAAYAPSSFGMSPYSSAYSPFGAYGGGTGMGYSGMFGDHLWQGFLGQTAESLGRINNLLTMTGMFVDHMANHSRMLYTRASELHSWYKHVKQWSEHHSEWMERLGLQVESGWRGSEDENVRKREIKFRRIRTLIIILLLIIFIISIKKKFKSNNSSINEWNAIYSNPLARQQYAQ